MEFQEFYPDVDMEARLHQSEEVPEEMAWLEQKGIEYTTSIYWHSEQNICGKNIQSHLIDIRW